MVGFLGRDNRGVGDQGEMDTRVWYQVGLEFGQVNVQGAVESQRGGDRWYNLADQSVQVRVRWSLDVQVTSADIVDRFVVDHESAVRMLEGGVRGQDRIVGLDDGGGYLKWNKIVLQVLTRNEKDDNEMNCREYKSL